MSGGRDAAILSTNFSQLGGLLIGLESHFTHRFWDKANLQLTDETSFIDPTRAGTQFNQTASYVQPRTATLTTEYVLEVVLSPSTLTSQPVPLPPAPGFVPWAPGNTPAAYVNNLGDQLLAQVSHRYGSTILHEYDGEYQQLYQRLTVNEVNEQYRNAMTLGGLPLSTTITNEAQRRQALVKGITIFVPLNRLWCTQHVDEAWMPEAFSTQGEIAIKFQRLERLVYHAVARGAPGAALPSPFLGGAPPTILSTRLFTRDVILTVPEKTARLSAYESDRGVLTHFLDREYQRQVITGAGGAGNREYVIKLDNIRMDMQELFFVVRRAHTPTIAVNEPAIDDDWSGDALQAPVYNFATEGNPVRVTSQLGILATAPFVDTMFDDIVSFRLQAGNKRLYDDQTELLGRTWVRRMYHPDSQPRDPIYFKSFSLIPEATKHVSGFQNAANLGNLTLVITMPNFPADQQKFVDVWCHSHNTNQSRRGDSVKSMH